MYKVYGTPNDRAFRILWLLEEMNLPYELIHAGPHSEPVLAVNPDGKVPVLLDDDLVLTESVAIMTYLADKHGAMTFPAGTPERAHQDMFTQMLLDRFESYLWMALRHTLILPQDRRVPQIKDTLKWEFETAVAQLDKRFVGPFLQGETMTIADILAVHLLNWAFSAKFPVKSEKLVDYANRMRARDAFKRAKSQA